MGLFIQLGLDNPSQTHLTRPPNPRSDRVQRQPLNSQELADALDLRFEANRFGPFASRLTHLLDTLDGSYRRSDKRIADAGPLDIIRFDDAKRDRVAAYLGSEGKAHLPSLEAITALIDGFETPLGMELLATVDWLITHGEQPELAGIKAGLSNWKGERTLAHVHCDYSTIGW